MLGWADIWVRFAAGGEGWQLYAGAAPMTAMPMFASIAALLH